MSSILNTVSQELVAFANSLNPDEEFIANGTALVENVFKTIKQHPNFSVAGPRYGGSLGKKTSVLYPDFDCIVFLNGIQPPLTEAVSDLKMLLKLNATELQILPESIKKSSLTVSAEFESGIEMDLLPACSFSQDNVEDQVDAVYENLRVYPERYLIYSSSLADIQIGFIKRQSSYTHQLIRLLKYWLKTLVFDEKLYGGSYLMEVLSVVVVSKPKNASNKILQNFKLVLEKISRIDSLRIAFLRENKECRLLTKTELEAKRDRFSSAIMNRKNFIIDPSNPYNDLMLNLSKNVVEKLKGFASEMLVRLEMLESPESNDMKIVSDSNGVLSVALRIDNIFEPHSLSLNTYGPEALPKYILIHYDYMSYKLFSSSVEVRSESERFFLQNKPAKKVSEAIRVNLVTLIRGKAMPNRQEPNKSHVFVNGLAKVKRKGDVREAVGKLLLENFEVGMFKECSEKAKHKECDVTLFIPYMCGEVKCAVRFSMKWG